MTDTGIERPTAAMIYAVWSRTRARPSSMRRSISATAASTHGTSPARTGCSRWMPSGALYGLSFPITRSAQKSRAESSKAGWSPLPSDAGIPREFDRMTAQDQAGAVQDMHLPGHGCRELGKHYSTTGDQGAPEHSVTGIRDSSGGNTSARGGTGQARPRDHPDRTRQRWRDGSTVDQEGSSAEGAGERCRPGQRGNVQARTRSSTLISGGAREQPRAPFSRGRFAGVGVGELKLQSPPSTSRKRGTSWPDMSTHPGMW